MKIEFGDGKVELTKWLPTEYEPVQHVMQRHTSVHLYTDLHEWGLSVLIGHRNGESWLEVTAGPFAVVLRREFE